MENQLSSPSPIKKNKTKNRLFFKSMSKQFKILKDWNQWRSFLVKCFYFYSRKHYIITIFAQASYIVLRWRGFFFNFWTLPMVWTDIWYCSLCSERGATRCFWLCLWQHKLDVILFPLPYLKFPTSLFYTKDAIQLYFLSHLGFWSGASWILYYEITTWRKCNL